MLSEEELNQQANKIVNLIVPKKNYNQAKQFLAGKTKNEGPLLDKLAQIKYPDRFNDLPPEEKPYAEQIALCITVILGYEKLQKTARKMLQNGEPVNAQSVTKLLDDENIRIDAAIQKTEDRIANDVGYIYDPKYINNIHNKDVEERMRREYEQETLSLKTKLPKLQEKLEINLLIIQTIQQKKDFDQDVTLAMESPKPSPTASLVQPETTMPVSSQSEQFIKATEALKDQSINQAPSPSSISTPQAEAARANSEDDFDFNQVRERSKAVTKQSEGLDKKDPSSESDKRTPKMQN